MDNISRRSFLMFATGAISAPHALPPWPEIAEVPRLLDHILLGSNDLDRGIAFVEEHTGVRAAFGGVHPGRGTENALLSLGERRYLEIIAPDPKQAGVEQYPVITKLAEPRLIGWAAHRDDLDEFAEQLRKQGIEFEGPQAGSRQRPDGKLLRWRALRRSLPSGRWREPACGPSNSIPCLRSCSANSSRSSRCAAQPISRGSASLVITGYCSTPACLGSGAMISR